MKTLRKFLISCLFLVGMGAVSALWAADNKLPEIGISKSAQAQEALKKDAICTTCHDESESKPLLSLYQTKHGVRADGRAPTCQSCHGESAQHAKGDKSTKARPAPDIVFKKGVNAATDDKEQSAQCLTCHKGKTRMNWDGGQHQNNGVACSNCHQTHKANDPVLAKKTQAEVCYSCHKEQRAETHKISAHPVKEGKVACSDCHNAHGSTAEKLLVKNTITETCYQCHAEKRGPFLFEHQPVTENCSNCHTPHGSNLQPLLKSRAPFLCQECHDGSHASQSPHGPDVGGTQNGLTSTPVRHYVGRSCQNCHSMIHGSNNPAGGYLER